MNSFYFCLLFLPDLNLLKLDNAFKERTVRLYFYCRPHYKVGVDESRLDRELKGLGMFFQLQDIFNKSRQVCWSSSSNNLSRILIRNFSIYISFIPTNNSMYKMLNVCWMNVGKCNGEIWRGNDRIILLWVEAEYQWPWLSGWIS